jgi:23S rRNA (uracil1939-C5)-methyltransferase
LRGYHRRRHEGDLRYLVLREGKNTGQRMALLIANNTLPSPLVGEGKDGGTKGILPPTSILPHEGGGGLWDDLRQRIEPLTTTCWLGVTDAKSDVARAEDMRLLWGPGTIEEKLGAITYRISPYSFFQTNTHGTEKLYSLLQHWGRDIRGALVDLYCGSGGITLALAGSFDRVVGIDTNHDAIEDAKKNALANGIENAEFVCEDALEFLKKLPGSKLSIQLSAIVVDPPRPGLHPQALRHLIEMNPPRLAYVSCNPESLARDLQSLVPLYTIRSVQPVDLFPHTAHVETVVLMEHR